MDNVSFLTRIRIFLLSLLIVIFLPILILSLLPIFILRYLTSLLKRCFRSDLGNLINAHSAGFAADDLWTAPRATLVSIAILGGPLKLGDLRANFRRRVLEVKPGSEAEGGRFHPELLQFPSTWMGFPVWVPEKHFSVDEHIKSYDGPIKFDSFTEEVWTRVADELVKRPYRPGKSPWEIYLIPNCVVENDPEPEVPKMALILRTHHVLVDGFSLVKLMAIVGGEGIAEAPLPNYLRRSWLSSLCYSMTFLFRIPYDFAEFLILRLDPIGTWHQPEERLSRNTAITNVPPIPFSTLREIRDVHQVTTTAVIVSVIAGAWRKVMLESGLGVPDYVSMAIPLPLPGHPSKLRNHVAVGVLRLPVGTADPLERMELIGRDMKRIRKSTSPALIFFLAKLLGSLYSCMTRVLTRQQSVTVILTNFPGPPVGALFMGIPILDVYLFGGMPGDIGMGASSVTCNGGLRIIAGIDHNLLPVPSHIDFFKKQIFKEISLLHSTGV